MDRHRVLDIVLVAVLLVPALLIGLVVAAVVLLDSPGPVLYRARRAGRGGQAFDMLKFRKMRVDACGWELTLGDEDERFTPIGRWLARTRLDELPQLVNVLRGDMHLVGPRPEAESFVGAYPDEYRRVLAVRPGITGATQLRFADEARLLRGAADPEALYARSILPRKITSDLEYLADRSVRGDLAILLRTALLALTTASGRRPAVAGGTVLVPAVTLVATFVLAAGPLH